MSDRESSSPWGEPPAAYRMPAPGYPGGSEPTRPHPARRAEPVVYPGEKGLRRLFRVTYSSAALIVIALGLGLALAGALGALIWAIATAIHHAATS